MNKNGEIAGYGVCSTGIYGLDSNEFDAKDGSTWSLGTIGNVIRRF